MQDTASIMQSGMPSEPVVEPAEGADLYVTLEPCCHYGKQPPCVEAIVQAGIKRVFVGSDDPNPLVAGKGIQYLRERGIAVETHVLKEECDQFKSGVLSFHPQKSALCGHEICHDPGWKDRGLHRCFKVGHRRGGQGLCAAGAAPIPRHHGGGRNGAGRRPYVNLPDAWRKESGADYLRHAFADTARFPGCEERQRRFPPSWPSARQTVRRYQPYEEAGCHDPARCPRSDGHVDLNAAYGEAWGRTDRQRSA